MSSSTQHRPTPDVYTPTRRWPKVAAVLVGLVLGLWVVNRQKTNGH